MIKDELKKLGIPTFKYVDGKQSELKEQFIEMSQLKSDFDIEKFTVRKEGNFIAHNFHFLMRQYSLALSEMKRMLIDKEDKRRRIEECVEEIKNGKTKKLIYTREGQVEKYIDLYRDELLNQIDMLEFGIVNKACMIKGFENCRLKLIELNGGEFPTNEEYQAEEPEYWKWALKKGALEAKKQAMTGIDAGIWMNIQYAEEPPLLNKEYQIKLLDDNGFLDLQRAKEEINNRMKYDKLDKIKLLKE